MKFCNKQKNQHSFARFSLLLALASLLVSCSRDRMPIQRMIEETPIKTSLEKVEQIWGELDVLKNEEIWPGGHLYETWSKQVCVQKIPAYKEFFLYRDSDNSCEETADFRMTFWDKKLISPVFIASDTYTPQEDLSFPQRRLKVSAGY